MVKEGLIGTQMSQAGVSGNHTTLATPSNDCNDKEILDIIQQRGAPHLYCYPSVRAHSGVRSCYHAACGRGPTLPPPLRTVLSAAASSFHCLVQGRGVNMTRRTVRAEAEEECIAKQISPSCGAPLVSDSTVSMVDAVLRHLCMVKGTPVFVPGFLSYPYYNLLELFDRWGLHIVGYDVDFVKMRVDENDLRLKARSVGLAGSTHFMGNDAKPNRTGSIKNSPPLLLFIGVGGRPISNIESMTHLVRAEFRAVTIELCPLTAAFLDREDSQKLSARADICVMAMDGAGEFGGALAFTGDPLLADGILQQLHKRPTASSRDHWIALALHIAHLLVSDGKSFKFVLHVLRWCSLLMSRKRGGSASRPHADHIFQFLLATRTKKPLSGLHTFAEVGESCDEGRDKATATVPPHTSNDLSFSKPHPGVIAWLEEAIARAHQDAMLECFSFWEFVSSLRNDVEVVSAGEPQTPKQCVTCHSNAIFVRVREPKLAARALLGAGFGATPLTPHWWGGRQQKTMDGAKMLVKGYLRRLSPHDIVLLPMCPMCEDLAQHALCVPLYPSMKYTNREKLRSAMQSVFPSSLFRSPSDKFHDHVKDSQETHAYHSTAVSNLIIQCKRSISRGEWSAVFSDAQPLLLRCLFGPIPAYVVSKL